MRLTVLSLVLFLLCAPLAAGQADLILRNGKIVTLDPAMPQAQALAIRGDTILATGSNAQIEAYAGPNTRTIDLNGKLAIPGFIEGHGHFTALGRYKMNLNLRNARNWNEIVSMVAQAAGKARPGEWIFGRGWHQSKWETPPVPNVQGFPVHEALSKVSPQNPVWLTHASGHASFANALALKLAEVSRNTPDPSGGTILKDADGNPTGLLLERAQSLLNPPYRAYESKRAPAALQGEARKEIELATQECLSKGIASFQDAGSSFETIDLFKKLAGDHQLGLRLWVMVRAPNAELARNLDRYRIIGMGGDRLTVRAIKRQMDGALGPRGAWLLEPYADLPGSSGLNTESVADIRKTAELAIAHNFQLCIHAIGDRANREVLNLYEDVFKEHRGKKDLRWRMEHAQHLSAPDIPRFGSLGVIASMQGIHCTSDAPYVLARLGPKRAEEGAYVWRKLMDSGAVVTNGTDAPVEDVDPLGSFYASVTRKPADGSVFFPEQRMTRDAALRSYTLNNAFAAFEEDRKGSLKPGKLADITVLSKDILAIPEDQILSAQVLYTIVGGRIAFQAAPQDSVKSRPDVSKALAYIKENEQAHLQKQITIAQIPAPPFEEKQRAAFLVQEFRRVNLEKVEIDPIGNVLGWRAGRSPRTLVIAAHLDTVFPPGTDVTVKRSGSLLNGPGLVDDTRGLTALLGVVEALQHAGIQTKHTLLFVADVGEEGLGNLRGIKYLFHEGAYRDRLDAFISIDGTGGNKIANSEMGSRRYRITVKGPGGHSYGDFGRVNPIHALGRIIARFAEVEIPAAPKSTFNVGRIGGGTSVNSIPFEAWMEVDMRSSDEDELSKIEKQLLKMARLGIEEENRFRSKSGTELQLDAKLLAVRRTARTPDDSPLVRAAQWAARAMRLTPELVVGSTDSNVPESMGIPAITIGGGGKSGSMHSLEEWFDPDRAYEGVQQILLTILEWDRL